MQLPIPLARAGSGAIALPSQIEMRFALGDLQCSPRRQPLGIACDPRWCWHELSHVLLAGAVNELEFRFAHSAGDALAAIVLDPDSKLATGHNSAWRGVTFPWIASRRRHDRDVALGWGWNGEMYQRERFFAGPDECCKRGYWAEQILSSSLFRLYRAIGGDSETSPGVVATAVRKAAADYAVYLIMKAIKLIGPASSVPAKTPDQFVSALIDADVGPKVVYNVPPHSTGAHRRSPGTAHKVIRWSFEQQGLYAHSPDGFPLARPGDPPTVDVYIDDGRHGHYSPISFLAGSWHAQPASFWIRHSSDARAGDQPPRPQRDNFVYLKVQNRGRHRASNVAVDVWVTPLTAPGAYPDFPGTGWQRLGSSIVKNVPAAGTHPGEEVFGPYTWSKPLSGRSYALLAVATCTDDRANCDPATGFLCANPANAGDAGPIAYLVACDNNLGLRENPRVNAARPALWLVSSCRGPGVEQTAADPAQRAGGGRPFAIGQAEQLEKLRHFERSKQRGSIRLGQFPYGSDPFAGEVGLGRRFVAGIFRHHDLGRTHRELLARRGSLSDSADRRARDCVRHAQPPTATLCLRGRRDHPRGGGRPISPGLGQGARRSPGSAEEANSSGCFAANVRSGTPDEQGAQTQASIRDESRGARPVVFALVVKRDELPGAKRVVHQRLRPRLLAAAHSQQAGPIPRSAIGLGQGLPHISRPIVHHQLKQALAFALDEREIRAPLVGKLVQRQLGLVELRPLARRRKIFPLVGEIRELDDRLDRA